MHPLEPAARRRRERHALQVDRIVIGLLLVGTGIAWLLVGIAVAVPWRLLPSAALLVVGAALILTLAGGRGRGNLIGLGAVLLVVATAVGIGTDRFVGPVGDRILAPTAAEWPIATRTGAGTVTVDLRHHPLPQSGRLDVNVGLGRILLLIPEEATPRIETETVVGAIRVDGVNAGEGLDVHWTGSDGAQPPVVISLQVGIGEIEVNHE